MLHTTTAICIIVFLGCIIQDLDALKSQSSYRNGLSRRSKRQVNPPVEDPYARSDCNFDGSNQCQSDTRAIFHTGLSVRNAVNSVQNRGLFVTGPVSLQALQNGGMCFPGTNLFTTNALSALVYGHLTIAQLSVLKLFPVPSVDLESLINAKYIRNIGEVNLLTAIGVQAVLSNHIDATQLQELIVYPLKSGTVPIETLINAEYVTKDCMATALGLAAAYIRYIEGEDFTAYGCPLPEPAQIEKSQLASAKYISGSLNILTPIALAALPKFTYRTMFIELNLFPFTANIENPSTTYEYSDSNPNPNVNVNVNQQSTIVVELVRAGYLQANNYFITAPAYHAIVSKYFNIEHFRSLRLWPCPGAPDMNAFVSAGYATYSGHLTGLGYSLLHAQYYPVDWLTKLGIHLRSEYYTFHNALRYGGFTRSEYHTAHTRSASEYQTVDPVLAEQYRVNPVTNVPVVADLAAASVADAAAAVGADQSINYSSQ